MDNYNSIVRKLLPPTCSALVRSVRSEESNDDERDGDDSVVMVFPLSSNRYVPRKCLPASPHSVLLVAVNILLPM